MWLPFAELERLGLVFGHSAGIPRPSSQAATGPGAAAPGESDKGGSREKPLGAGGRGEGP